MSKFPSIFVAKPSRIGDITVFASPFVTYLKKIYPESYVTFCVDKSCSQIAPFLLNLNGIDNIRISKETDKIVDEDYNGKEYDLIFNGYPQLTRPDYYNHHSVQKENFIMSEILNGYKINPKEYDLLTEEEKYPRFNKYFDGTSKLNFIGIWPFSGYNKSEETDKRSPSKEWWNKLVERLNEKDYNILVFGHPNSEKLKGVQNMHHLSLFDSIKMSMECDLSITTDSGVSHILGAYGANQICLYSNYLLNHFQNFEAMCPMNFRNNLIKIWGEGNINNINQETVLEEIRKFK